MPNLEQMRLNVRQNANPPWDYDPTMTLRSILAAHANNPRSDAILLSSKERLNVELADPPAFRCPGASIIFQQPCTEYGVPPKKTMMGKDYPDVTLEEVARASHAVHSADVAESFFNRARHRRKEANHPGSTPRQRRKAEASARAMDGQGQRWVTMFRDECESLGLSLYDTEQSWADIQPESRNETPQSRENLWQHVATMLARTPTPVRLALIPPLLVGIQALTKPVDSVRASAAVQQQSCTAPEEALWLPAEWKEATHELGCWNPNTRVLRVPAKQNPPNAVVIHEDLYCAAADEIKSCVADLRRGIVGAQAHKPEDADWGGVGDDRRVIVVDTDRDGTIEVFVHPRGNPGGIYVRNESSPDQEPTPTPTPKPTPTPDPLAADPLPPFPKNPKPLAPNTTDLLGPIWENAKPLIQIKLIMDGIGMGILGLEGVAGYYFFDKDRRAQLQVLVGRGQASQARVNQYMAPLEREGNTRRLLYLTTNTAFSWLSFVAATGAAYRSSGYAATPAEATAGYLSLIQIVDSLPVRYFASLPARAGFTQLLRAHELVSSALYAMTICSFTANLEYFTLPSERYAIGALLAFTILRFLNVRRKDPLHS